MRRITLGVAASGVLLALSAACGGDDGPAGGGGASADAGADSTTPPQGDAGPQEPTPGCGATGGPTGFSPDQALSVNGAKRTYELFVPEAHDGKKVLPLVFVFHGNGGDGAGMRRGYKLEAEANGGAIFVYPNGFGGWDLDTPAAQNDDVAFVEAMLDTLGKAYCVDKKRVFATGYSNGGYFSNQLACRKGSLFRAIASHAGGGPYGGSGDYDQNGDLVCPEGPVAALIAHGTNDGAVALGEGVKSRDHWTRVNGCKSTTKAYDPSPCVQYDGCADGRPVVWCQVQGLGHTVWPEGGAKATWKFFSSL